MAQRRDKEITASDGLLAYVSGGYAEQKLDFIDFFCPSALQVTSRMVRRVYVDLFAGPGLNVLKPDMKEIEGGALRVLASRAHSCASAFTHAHLINLERTHDEALQARVKNLRGSGRCGVPTDAVRFWRDNANVVVTQVMGEIAPRDYVLVFADIEAPRQLPWSTIQALKAKHDSVDLYMLFPLEMGLNRLSDYGGMTVGNERIFTAFFGDESWKPILGARVTEAQSAETKRLLETRYLDRLREHWETAVKVMDVRLAGRQGLYRMLFATSNKSAKSIASWAKKHAAMDSGQGTLL